MKLLNHTLSYLAIAFLFVIGIWAVIFYFNFLDEIYDSIDDGLKNSKILIISRVQQDSSLIYKDELMESNYAFRKIDQQHATTLSDSYFDSTIYMVNEQDFEPVRVLKSAFRTKHGEFYELQIISSMVEEDDLIEDLLYALVWLYLILIASILLINNFVLRKVWKPFYGTITSLRSFSVERNNDIELPETNVTEFKALNETINALIERTRNSFNSQKEFIENVSHELQTPVAISLNKLELLAEESGHSAKASENIGDVIENLERLKRFNKSLLLLSKIENRQFSETSTVNVNNLVAKLAADYSDLIEFKSLTINVTEKANLIINMNEELARIMIGNLIRNAIVHNLPNGKVDVVIDQSRVTIINSGDPNGLDPSKVFTRFYRNTTNQNSTGLGLAIVKSIATYYNMRVEYSYHGAHKFSLEVNV